MTISNISLFDVYLSTLPYYSLCVCLCVCTQTMIPYTVSLSLSHLSVCPSLPLSVCLSVSLSHTHAHIHTNTHILAITNIFCVQCVLTAQLPFLLPPHTSSILPLQHGLHDCHSLLSPPPTHAYTHRSASQSCVDCTTVWPVCVQRPAVSTFWRHHGSESRGLLRLFLGNPAPTVPSRHLQQQCRGL